VTCGGENQRFERADFRRLIHFDALGVLGAGDLERGRGKLPVDSHGGIAGHKVVAAGLEAR
jgi:hypothetical protein